jgi:hypothetical protein
VPIGRIPHPTDPTAIVLRLTSSGGFMAPSSLFLNGPTFTLFGDNTIVMRPSNDPNALSYPPYVVARLTADQVDALLGDALDTAGMRTAKPSYGVPVPDAGSTVFMINADGVAKIINVAGAAQTGPDKKAIEALRAFANRLAAFDATLPTGTFAAYQPIAYQALLSPEGQPVDGATAWPWSDLTLADFPASVDDPSMMLGTLSPDQVGMVTDVPSGGVSNIDLIGPDGMGYSLALRPMLPDETP